MNLFAPQHLVPILIILLLLFGRGKISEIMGDFAKGIKSFKKGLQDDDDMGEDSSSAVRGTIKTHNQEEPHSAVMRKTASRTSVQGSSKNKS